MANQSPVIADTPAPRRGAVLDHLYVFDAAAADADNDMVVWELYQSPPGMTVDPFTGRVQYRPTAAADLGQHTIHLAAFDLYGGQDVLTWILTVRGVNQPPSINSDPPTLLASTAAGYSYQVSAQDPEDGPLSYALVEASIAGLAFVPGTNVLEWLPPGGNPYPLGTHDITIRVTDELNAADTQRWQLVVYDPAINQPPEFLETPRAWAIVGEPYSYAPLALDPNDTPVSYGMSFPNAPAGVAWDPQAPSFDWTPATADLGVKSIVFTANDGVLVRRQTLELLVRNNAAPSVTRPDDALLAAGQMFQTAVIATDPDGDSLTFSVDGASSAKGIQIDDRGTVTWLTGAVHVGEHAVSVTANDGFGKQDSETFTITVVADTTPPQVTVIADPNPAQLDREYLISVTATDNVAVSQVSLTLVGFTPPGGSAEPRDETIPLNQGGKARITPDVPGSYAFQARAVDLSGNPGTQTLIVDVVPNIGGPTVIITSPHEGAQLKEPVFVIGTIVDELDDVQNWTLTAQPLDGGAAVIIAQATLGQQATELTSAPLGLLDTSLLANGLYTLALTATDTQGATSETSRQVEIRGNLKLGNFTFSVTDLTVNTPGIPITVSRTYDTLTAGKQLDFGYGWKWDVGNPKLQIHYSDTRPTMFSGNHVPFRDGTRVVITLPDGTEEGFTFRPFQTANNGFGMLFGGEPYVPYFEPDPGVTNFLGLKKQIRLSKQLDEYLVDGGSGSYSFNPASAFTQNDFVLYTQQGIQYGIDPAGSGRTWIEDNKGNRVEYIPQGDVTLIRHSNARVPGGLTRTVTVCRVGGRISQIVDPAGNSIWYTYAGGELMSVTDRLGKTTSYEYAGASDPWYQANVHAHYLKTIVDPLGRRAVAAEYRGDGRLDRTRDAEETATEFSYELANRSQAAASTGIVSTVIGDADGNVVRQEGPQGVVLRSYDNRGRVLTETTVVGQIDSAANGQSDDLTVEYAYTAFGLPASQTDPRGNSTTLQYDDRGNVVSLTDALGNATANVFDGYGNLLISKTAGVETTFAYDAWGNVTRVQNQFGQVLVQNFYNAYGLLERSIDASGNETQFVYDPLGNQIEARYVASETVDTPQGPQEEPVTFTTRTVRDAEGRVTETHRLAQRASAIEQPLSSTFTHYNDAGQVVLSRSREYRADGSFTELATEQRYNARGLVVETRSEGLATGESVPVVFVQRNVYDTQGRVVYATDRSPEGTPVAEITGVFTEYDAAGRATLVSRLRGLEIAVSETAGVYASAKVGSHEVLSTTSHVYENDRLVEATDAYGRKSQYTYNHVGDTTQVRRQSVDEYGTVVWLVSRSVYDRYGRVTFATDEYLEGTTQPRWGTQTLYDGQGRAAQTVRRVGAVIALDAAGQTSVVKEGSVVYHSTTRYDAQGRVQETVAADGQITTFEYDALGRRTAVLGHPQRAGSVGLVVQGDPLVRLRSETVYGSDGRIAEERTNIRQYAEGTIDRSAQQVTAYRYDAAGNVVAQSQSAADSPLVVQTQWEYDAGGRKTAEIDAVGNRTEYQQDEQGRLTRVILPAVADPLSGGALTSPNYEYRYDAAGNHTHIIDPYGKTTVFSFDSAGRQLTRTLPLGFGEDGVPQTADDPPDAGLPGSSFTESYRYDAFGRQVLHVSFEGVVTEFVYNDAPLPSGAGSAEGSFGRLAAQQFYPNLAAYNAGQGTPVERWLYRYDAFGREVRVERQTLDAQGSVTESLVSTSTYDAAGHKLRVESPEGAVNHRYDALGRKTRTFTGDVPNPAEDWTYTYDPLGRLKTVTSVTRDGRPIDIYVVHPNARSSPDIVQPEATTYHYDLLGNLDWQTSSRYTWVDSDGLVYPYYFVTDYEYDALNRLVGVVQLPGWDAEFPLGAVPFAQFDYQLRADGKRVSASERLPEVDAGGQSATQIKRFEWEYDALGRLVDELLAIQLDIATDSWQSLYRDRYEFDLAGNRLRKTTDLDLSTAEVDEVITYFYDANDRLLEEHRDLGANGLVDELIRYGYDFTQQTEKRVETADDPPVLKQLVQHQYDLQGRLQATSIEDFAADGATVVRRETTSFDYDHTGIRVSNHNRLEKYDDTTKQLEPRHDLDTSYLVDHDNFTGYAQVLSETTTSTATGNTIREVIYTLGHDVIGQWSSGAIYTYFDGDGSTEFLIPAGSHAFLYDAHGSNRGLVTRGNTALYTGQIVAKSFTYDAYGNPLGFHPLYAGTSLLYSGEWFQIEIDQQYLRARWYDAATGRFIQRDPILGHLNDPLSLHKYAYVHADPVNGVDPTGQMVELIGFFVASGLQQAQAARKHAADFATYSYLRMSLQVTSSLARARYLAAGASYWMYYNATLAAGTSPVWIPRVQRAVDVLEAGLTAMGLMADLLHFTADSLDGLDTDVRGRRIEEITQANVRGNVSGIDDVQKLDGGRLFVTSIRSHDVESPEALRAAIRADARELFDKSHRLMSGTDFRGQFRRFDPDNVMGRGLVVAIPGDQRSFLSQLSRAIDEIADTTETVIEVVPMRSWRGRARQK